MVSGPLHTHTQQLSSGTLGFLWPAFAGRWGHLDNWFDPAVAGTLGDWLPFLDLALCPFRGLATRRAHQQDHHPGLPSCGPELVTG